MVRYAGLFVVVVLASCAAPPVPIAVVTPPPAVATPPEPVSMPAAIPAALELTVAAVGDVMLGTDYPEDYLPPDDGLELLRDSAPLLRAADITFGNFEGTLLDGGTPVKRCKDSKHCYLFRTPTRYVQRLREAGFTVMSLANNHARDFGETGRNSTMQTLSQAGILHSGREGDIATWQVKGRRIALIAYAPFAGAHDPADTEQAKQTVAALAAQNDIVIVSMHMGAEGQTAIHVIPGKEYFQGEDRGDSIGFAHTVIDAGADLVIGHGPHVPRAVELYHDRLIAYSLGNFCTYQGINVTGTSGLAPVLEVTLGADGQFLHGQIISTRQQRPGGPVLDTGHTAAQLMAQLTDIDFPHTELTITGEGKIEPKRFSASGQPPLVDDKSLPDR
ncbi:MAG: CapA family protein [Gammaproteobacteria bacterium]|nr:CapA family protein [Gammaproteobacteria bacterium]